MVETRDECPLPVSHERLDEIATEIGVDPAVLHDAVRGAQLTRQQQQSFTPRKYCLVETLATTYPRPSADHPVTIEYVWHGQGRATFIARIAEHATPADWPDPAFHDFLSTVDAQRRRPVPRILHAPPGEDERGWGPLRYDVRVKTRSSATRFVPGGDVPCGMAYQAYMHFAHTGDPDHSRLRVLGTDNSAIGGPDGLTEIQVDLYPEPVKNS